MTNKNKTYHYRQLEHLVDVEGKDLYTAFHDAWKDYADIAKGYYKGNTYIFNVVRAKDDTVSGRVDRVLVEEDKVEYRVSISRNSKFLCDIKWIALPQKDYYFSLDERIESAKRMCEYNIAKLQNTLTMLNNDDVEDEDKED